MKKCGSPRRLHVGSPSCTGPKPRVPWVRCISNVPGAVICEFVAKLRAWSYEIALAETLMLELSQSLTSALETVGDYLWNFIVARTHLREPFVLVMHQFGKLRYFVSNLNIKADTVPASPQCSAASNYILEAAIFLVLALRFAWRTDTRSRWLAFRQKCTF